MIGIPLLNTLWGQAEQVGIDTYRIKSGEYIGLVLLRIKSPFGDSFRVIRVDCPSGYTKTNDFPYEKCKKNISVIPVNENSKNGNNGTAVIPKNNGTSAKSETNWLLYGAIALGAILLLRR